MDGVNQTTEKFSFYVVFVFAGGEAGMRVCLGGGCLVWFLLGFIFSPDFSTITLSVMPFNVVSLKEICVNIMLFFSSVSLRRLMQ